MRSLVLLITACGHSSATVPASVDASADASADARVLSDATLASDYDSDGAVPYQVTSQTLSNGLAVTLYMPMSAGKHPVVALSCGTNQTGHSQSSIAMRGRG